MRVRSLAWLGLFGFGCTAGSAPRPAPERFGRSGEPIINGSVDSGHPAVVAYLHDNEACSATIVAVNGDTGFALTAGHCVGASLGELRQGQDYQNPDATYGVTDATTHPGYPASKLYDVAMLKFSGAAGAPAMGMAGASDGLGIGTNLDQIGFGETQDNAGQNTVRHEKTLPVNQLTALRILYDQSAGGLCHGDSGGPSTNPAAGDVVVGVHSYVEGTQQNPQTCLNQATDMRVSATVDTFIKPYINGQAPGQQTCAQCQEAHIVAGACTPKLTACLSDASCSALVDCLNGCQTEDCVINCDSAHQAGLGLYQQIFACVCQTACTAECGQDPVCNPPKCGFNFQSPACESCMDQNCCAEASACAQSTTCYDCATQLIQQQKCKTDPTTVAYQQCVNSHCAMPCGGSSPTSSSAASSSGAGTTGASSSAASGTGGGKASSSAATSGAGGQGQQPTDIVESSCALRGGGGALPSTELQPSWPWLIALGAVILARRRERA